MPTARRSSAPPMRAPSLFARAAAVLARHVGWLLLVCGGVLAVIGIAVQGARSWRLAGEVRTAAAPRFEDTLAAPPPSRAPAAAAPAAAAAPDAMRSPGGTTTADAGAVKRVAQGGLDVVVGPRVVVFGAGGDADRSTAGRGAPAAARPTAAPTSLPPPDRIEIRAIDVDRPVVPIGWTAAVVDNDTLESVWKTADDAAGWHKTSAPPAQIGNTVISGHNNIAGAVFARLNELKEGDTIALHAGSAEVRYTVERTFIVKEAGASDEERRANNRWIEPTTDERLTLVTCYPPWGNTHRLIVIARPVVYILPTATAGEVNGKVR